MLTVVKSNPISGNHRSQSRFNRGLHRCFSDTWHPLLQTVRAYKRVSSSSKNSEGPKDNPREGVRHYHFPLPILFPTHQQSCHSLTKVKCPIKMTDARSHMRILPTKAHVHPERAKARWTPDQAFNLFAKPFQSSRKRHDTCCTKTGWRPVPRPTKRNPTTVTARLHFIALDNRSYRGRARVKFRFSSSSNGLITTVLRAAAQQGRTHATREGVRQALSVVDLSCVSCRMLEAPG